MSFALDFRAHPGPGGPLSYALVPWDAELFGMPFYELRCDGPVEDIERSLPAWHGEIGKLGQPALVFTRILPAEVRLAEVLSGFGFYPAETTLQISLPLRRFTPIHPRAAGRARLRPAQANDLPAMVAIAEETFTTDRFHLDPHVPTPLSDKRYAQWVERGFRDGDPLFVYESTAQSDTDRDIIGFYLIRGEQGGEVDLSLAGVGSRYRRGGGGALMYEAMLEKCRELGYRTASSTISINNLDVVNLFMCLGFVVRSARLTMHLFISDSSRRR
jgi:L-amino acid N-acyltransferase YncA